MHEIQLLVTVQVESDGEIARTVAQQAAKEAIRNAIQFADDNGFVCPDNLSIGFVDIVVHQ